jgi:colicin import membrane protein
MKKWIFVIFPGILLGIFLAFYFPNHAETIAALQRQAEEVQRQKDALEAKKKADQEAAHKSAVEQAAKQAQEDAQKEAEAKAKWDAATAEIQRVTDEATNQANAYSKEANDLEIELDALQKQKEQENRNDFDLLKQVELSRQAQRAAENEIQRMVDMIAQKADQSAMAQMPPPAPVPAP